MLDQAINALKTYEWGVDPKVLQPIDQAIISSHDDAAARKDLEARLIAVLQTEIPRAAKDAVCRALRVVGTAECVPSVAPLLLDEKLSHMARYALEPIPAPEAGQALLAALQKVRGKSMIGVISSLGERRETAAIAPLKTLLSNNDPAIARSAARALGSIGSLAAAKALVTSKPDPAAKAATADASMECAEELLATGNRNAAKVTYERILAGNPCKPVQAAATLGMKAVATK